MASFNAQTLNYKVRNANSVVMLLGDQEIAFGQTVSLSSSLGAEQLYGIGSIKPQEVQQLKASPSISIDTFALTAEGIAILGYPSTLGDVLANNQFNFYVMDAAGNVIQTYVGCTAGDYNTSYPANQPVTESITFLALDILDALGVSILNSNSALDVVTTAANVLNLGGI